MSIRHFFLFFLAVFLPCSLVPTRGQMEGQVVLRVANREVTLADYLQVHGGLGTLRMQTSTRREDALQRYIDFLLLVHQAESQQVDTLPAVRHALSAYRQDILRQWFEQAETGGVGDASMLGSDPTGLGQNFVLLSQITLRLPQHSPAAAVDSAQRRMDSVYHALQQGADFQGLAQHVSAITAPSWMIPEDMTIEMGNVIHDLRIGQISAPFWSPEGVHIVKVIDRRLQTGSQFFSSLPSKALIDSLKQAYSYTANRIAIDELMARGSTAQVLFTLGEGLEVYDGRLFPLYAQAHPQALSRQLDGFISKSVLDYAARRAMQPHAPLAQAVQARRDSLLYRELMRSLLAGHMTSQALENYFQAHQGDYRYPTPHYRGTVVHARTKRELKQARKFLRSLPPEEHERAIALVFRDSIDPHVVVEHGLFALGDNAFVDQLAFGRERAQPLPSHPYTLLVGSKVKGPQHYSEVMSRLRDDLARTLTQGCIQALRSRTKVEINQEVLKTVNSR